MVRFIKAHIYPAREGGGGSIFEGLKNIMILGRVHYTRDFGA